MILMSVVGGTGGLGLRVCPLTEAIKVSNTNNAVKIKRFDFFIGGVDSSISQNGLPSLLAAERAKKKDTNWCLFRVTSWIEFGWESNPPNHTNQHEQES